VTLTPAELQELEDLIMGLIPLADMMQGKRLDYSDVRKVAHGAFEAGYKRGLAVGKDGAEAPERRP
jgi:hypothetical protein